jgi:hypothetical protein
MHSNRCKKERRHLHSEEIAERVVLFSEHESACVGHLRVLLVVDALQQVVVVPAPSLVPFRMKQTRKPGKCKPLDVIISSVFTFPERLT